MLPFCAPVRGRVGAYVLFDDHRVMDGAVPGAHFGRKRRVGI